MDDEALRHVLDIRDAFGSVLYVANLSEKPGENHYADPIVNLLETAEDKPGRNNIVPGTTRIVENTSGSLGSSFGKFTEVLKFLSEIITSDSLPPVREFRIREFNSHGVVTLASSAEGFIGGMQKQIEQRIREFLSTGTRFHCLNHSRNEAAVSGFRIIGEEIRASLPADARLDYWISGVGNGGSTLGIGSALWSDPRNAQMQSAFFRDAAGRGQSVSMEGVGGQGSVFFPFIQRLPPHLSFSWNKSNWWDIYERYNKDKERRMTIGHSSAGGLAAVRRIIEQERRPLILLTQIYDKADTNGSMLVTSDSARYIANEQWSDGINLRNLKLET